MTNEFSVLSPTLAPSPISQLPPEILEEIFALCISWFYPYQKAKNRFAWMQVCRTWQLIGLNATCLWQHIDLNNPACVATFLLRSRRAPLYITGSPPIESIPVHLALYASRVHSIDVALSGFDMRLFLANLGSDLPNLTVLSLKSLPSAFTSAIFVNLSFPSLRHLSLDGVSIRWEACRNLTSFSLRTSHPNQPAVCLSLSQLLALFAASPDLEYIRLESFIPSPGDTVEFPPFTLGRLKNFLISSYPAVIRSLLSTVQFGPQTRLQLYVSEFEDLCSIFLSHPHGYQHLTTSPQDAKTVRISRYGVYIIQNNAPAWCDDPVMFRISLSSASLAGLHVCKSLDQVIDLASITRLEFNISVLLDIPQQAFKNLFRDLHRLEDLCTAFNELVDLLYVLGSVDETTRLVYFPRLVKLSFGKRAETWWHFGDRWIESILGALGTRLEHSSTIRVLEFWGCEGLTSERIEALKKMADEVVIFEQPGSDWQLLLDAVCY